MDTNNNQTNMSHVADDFEDSSVDEENYTYEYNNVDLEGVNLDDTQSQKRSIKKWTAEEVFYFVFFLIYRFGLMPMCFLCYFLTFIYLTSSDFFFFFSSTPIG